MSTSTRILGCVLSASLLTQLSACGTLFYPDRRGQIEGKVDPVIVALDAIGILFYVLPGLIALGVDFATGAIYLPGGHTAQVDPQALENLVDSQGQVDRAKLKALIMQKTGKNLPLDDPRVIEHRGDLQQLAAYGLRPAA
ncbi:polyribonucleotide nucleotidyltransferase [Pseudomonas sp.]|uniref:polyribonucleotide nucleotidyltransferase n=1 Tax=Pseudomonas sp. TaxID=306 RepID=UPI003A98865C